MYTPLLHNIKSGEVLKVGSAETFAKALTILKSYGVKNYPIADKITKELYKGRRRIYFKCADRRFYAAIERAPP